jgi:hypothetical protein
MRAALGFALSLFAISLAACSQPSPPEPTRENEDTRKPLPDAYKHPPK